MSAGKRNLAIVAWLFLCGFPSRHLLAQGHVEADLTLTTLPSPIFGPTVSTAATAKVIGPDGNQLATQIIVGHKLTDLDIPLVLSQARYVSEIGSTSGSIHTTGVYLHCYQADMAIHVNAFNLHTMIPEGPDCAETYQAPPKPEVPDENCPVLLDLQQDGFHLSGPDPAVGFDIDADGTLNAIAWTQAGEDDAFLCWDRNGNGVIDDGRELFGYATPLLSGGLAIVGYRALADLDELELGGNRDGKVDGSDQAFQALCAWVDRNRDGVSQSDEIQRLDEVGVVSLQYVYATTGLRDQYGNLFRYTSLARMRSPGGAIRTWYTFDVIFAGAATGGSQAESSGN